jgi:5,10-methylenetetrahydromethanopterin reductase
MIAHEVREAEELGFDYAWLADIGLNRDVYVAMTMCAMKTTSILLGTSVTNPYTRHPAITAAAFATLDELSKERMVIGIGIGSKKNLLEPLGILRENTGQMFREAIKVMRSVMNGTSSSFQGQFYRLSGARLGFRAGRTIPIYIAGRGRGTLTIAGEIADGVIFSSLATPEAVRYAMDAINRGAKIAGREPAKIEKALFTRVLISGDTNRAREEIRPLVPYRLWDDSYDTIRQLGYDEERVRRIKNAYERGELKKATELVTDQMLEDFAVAGTIEYCTDKIEKLRLCGVTQLIVSPVDTEPPRKEEFLRQFSEQVMRRFK